MQTNLTQQWHRPHIRASDQSGQEKMRITWQRRQCNTCSSLSEDHIHVTERAFKLVQLGLGFRFVLCEISLFSLLESVNNVMNTENSMEDEVLDSETYDNLKTQMVMICTYGVRLRCGFKWGVGLGFVSFFCSFCLVCICSSGGHSFMCGTASASVCLSVCVCYCYDMVHLARVISQSWLYQTCISLCIVF